MSLLFSGVRVHLTEQNDPLGHTLPIGQRLSMAALDRVKQLRLYFVLVVKCVDLEGVTLFILFVQMFGAP